MAIYGFGFRRKLLIHGKLLTNSKVYAFSKKFSDGSTGLAGKGEVLLPAKPNKSFRFRNVSLGIVAITGIASAYLYYTDDGFQRSVIFWRRVLPRFMHYKYVEYITLDNTPEEKGAAFDVLHEKYAPELEQSCLELRGYYLKAAQMFSTMDNFLPEPYLRWTTKLQDEVPTELSAEQAKDIIIRNLGLKNLEDEFIDFVPKPIGCASIGQVYKAKLKTPFVDDKTGEVIQTVAIKVMSPGIEKRFRSDLTTLKSFCRFALPQFLSPLNEIEKQFFSEFDFVLEAENQNLVHDNIMPVYGNIVKIPKPIMKFCTKEVLVMEFLEGKQFIKAVKENFQRIAKKTGRNYEELEREQKELIKSGKFNFHDIESEIRRTKKNQFWLDSGRRLNNFNRFIYNHTIGMFLGHVEYEEKEILLNLGEIIHNVSIVHGHEIMVDGAVNGDPHPGNILLLKDGRLGLIDYGQVKHLNDHFRKSYAKLIIALAEEDPDKVMALTCSEFGVQRKYNKPEVHYRLAKFWNDSNSKAVIGDKNIHYFLESMEAQDPIVVINDDVVIPGRVNFLLRAMGNAFGIDIHMAKLWEPIARKVLDDENEKY